MKCGVRQIITVMYMCQICAKGFLDQTMIRQLLTKYQFFMKFPFNFKYSQKYFFTHIWRLIVLLLLQLKVLVACKESTFSILPFVTH